MGKSFADWKASGNDTHSLTGDPQFINRTGGDYTLTSESPAIDVVSGVPEAPSPDFAGNKRPFGKGSDMGALERVQRQ